MASFSDDCDAQLRMLIQEYRALQKRDPENPLLNCAVADFGVDFVLPDQQWTRLAPEGGLLCANCICKRAAAFGGTAILGWINSFNYQKAES